MAVVSILAKYQGITQFVVTPEMGPDDTFLNPSLNDHGSCPVSKENARVSILIISDS
jgi:hypothetical protein